MPEQLRGSVGGAIKRLVPIIGGGYFFPAREFAAGGQIAGPQSDSIMGVDVGEAARTVWLDDPIVPTREMIEHSCEECT
ncbi:hypothetical protein FFI94_022150 [Rhodococcus sp. KBS0724]|uniref:hypothetical protein n=1 Tax=Rhodococcus sp. KBS0724 TaxID=1179674 RepID=UPI00110D736A|nr:hypothetical protein [Rhodococcus sp. KBS0724]TSD48569.1 hypothetical protein FFI94_022150 [Rhodococcus sp. KBS0724]